MIETEFESSKIKHHFKVVNGATPKSDVAEFWDGDITWVTPADLSKISGNEISASSKTITSSGYSSCGTTLVPAGSIVLSTRAPIGTIAIASQPLCTNQGCKTLVSASDDYDAEFLYWVLSVSSKELNLLGRGTTFLELPTDELANFPVPIPPHTLQKIIIEYIRKETARIDTLINEKQNFINLLKEKRQALISHFVTKGLDANVPMKDSGVEWIGDVPEHWSFCIFKRGIDFLTDYEANGSFSTIKENVEIDTDEKFAWYLRATDLEKQRYGLVQGNRTVNKASYDFLSKTKLYGKELLMAKRGEIGKVYVAPELSCPTTLAPNLYLLRLNDRILLSDYAYYWFVSTHGQSELKLADKSTTIGALYKDDVKECNILMPPLEEQLGIITAIELSVSRIDALTQETEASIELLKEHRTALISAAVTGKIDVRGMVDTKEGAA